MTPGAARHVLRRAVRSLWENAYLNLVAVGVIAAALVLIGAVLTARTNLALVLSEWGRDVHVSAYFRDGLDETQHAAVQAEVESLPGVAEARYVSAAEARAWMAERMDGLDEVLAELGDEALPASLEITLQEGGRPADVAQFAETLSGGEEGTSPFEAVDYGAAWVERFHAFLAMLQLLGGLLGALVGVAALFLVMNTVHLIAYNRREELEIQKLVGGTPAFIVAPYLMEGAVQGLLGAGVAVAALWGAHGVLLAQLSDALGLAEPVSLAFLSSQQVALLVGVGVVLAAGASAAAAARFLSRAP